MSDRFILETEGAATNALTQSAFHDLYAKNALLGLIGRSGISAVTHLTLDDSSWITGETVLVSGGHR